MEIITPNRLSTDGTANVSTYFHIIMRKNGKIHVSLLFNQSDSVDKVDYLKNLNISLRK